MALCGKVECVMRLRLENGGHFELFDSPVDSPEVKKVEVQQSGNTAAVASAFEDGCKPLSTLDRCNAVAASSHQSYETLAYELLQAEAV